MNEKMSWEEPKLEKININSTESGSVFNTIESFTTGVGPS